MKQKLFLFALTALSLLASCKNFERVSDGVQLLISLLAFAFVLGYLWICDETGRMAKRYGRSYAAWFLLSLVWPFCAIVVLYILGRTEQRKRLELECEERVRIETRLKYEHSDPEKYKQEWRERKILKEDAEEHEKYKPQ
jgi:hypothetical protein